MDRLSCVSHYSVNKYWFEYPISWTHQSTIQVGTRESGESENETGDTRRKKLNFGTSTKLYNSQVCKEIHSRRLREKYHTHNKQRQVNPTYFVVKFSHIELRYVSREEMILGLIHNGCDAVELSTVGIGFHYFRRGPFRRSPVHGPTIIYHLIHCTNNF